MQSYDEAFGASYTRVMGSGAYNSAFIGRFYDLLLDSSAEIAARFANTDMSHQKTMLHDSFTTLIDFNQRRQVTPQMRRLGQVHSKSGANIAPALYTLWLDSLMDTVSEFDPEFNEDVELAWRLSLAPGIAYLQHAYRNPVDMNS